MNTSGGNVRKTIDNIREKVNKSPDAIKVVLVLILALIVCIGIRIWYNDYYKKSSRFTMPVRSSIDGQYYQIHKEYEDKEEAANVFAKINKNNKIIADHLKNKYRVDGPYDNTEKQYVAQHFLQKYNYDNLVEMPPFNPWDYTSYTENKGEIIAYCIREKKPGADFHDLNTIMFVNIHELSHLANDTIGHETDFWEIFRFMLKESKEAEENYNKTHPNDPVKIIEHVNYTKSNPQEYCGMKPNGITYNPIFDPTLRELGEVPSVDWANKIRGLYNLPSVDSLEKLV